LKLHKLTSIIVLIRSESSNIRRAVSGNVPKLTFASMGMMGSAMKTKPLDFSIFGPKSTH